MTVVSKTLPRLIGTSITCLLIESGQAKAGNSKGTRIRVYSSNRCYICLVVSQIAGTYTVN